MSGVILGWQQVEKNEKTNKKRKFLAYLQLRLRKWISGLLFFRLYAGKAACERFETFYKSLPFNETWNMKHAREKNFL